MFTKVVLKNYRSFDTITFDLTGKNNHAKNLAIIYGENGCGKSNLMSSFALLKDLSNTMNVRDSYEKFLNAASSLKNESLQNAYQKLFQDTLRDIQTIIRENRMVDNNEPVSVHYEFIIEGNAGSYDIELGEEEIIHEHLEYKLQQRRGVHFDCTPESIQINPQIVKGKELLKDIKSLAQRFWGKHSMLAIISHEIYDKSYSFAKENLSDNFSDVLYELCYIASYRGNTKKGWDKPHSFLRILNDPIEGTISRQNEKQLIMAENLFSGFFASINSEIKEVFYKKTYNEKNIDYKLYIRRLISDSYRAIDFAKESSGNHQLVKVLCFFLLACLGKTVVLDEADSSIHDFLFQKIVQEIKPYIEGQLIMTTHNTMLMESSINHDSIYIISSEPGGHKQIHCIPEYEKRTFLANNIQKKYLANEYNGLPKVSKIDFSELLQQLQTSIMEMRD